MENITNSGSGTFMFNQGENLPQRKGKQYASEEECVRENGEHVWSEPFDPNPNISCCVMHYDGHCSWHDPQKICYHCPATRTLQITQQEKKEWI
jgi:hypothetical protein